MKPATARAQVAPPSARSPARIHGLKQVQPIAASDNPMTGARVGASMSRFITSRKYRALGPRPVSGASSSAAPAPTPPPNSP